MGYKVKQKQELKRLYWKTDKELILHTLHRVNVKYISSLFHKARHSAREYCDRQVLNYRNSPNFDCNNKKDWESLRSINENTRTIAYSKVTVSCKYDGYIFNVSLKTLKNEIYRREKNHELMLDVLYSPALKGHYLTTVIFKNNKKTSNKHEGRRINARRSS